MFKTCHRNAIGNYYGELIGTGKQNVYTLCNNFAPIINPYNVHNITTIQQLTHKGTTYTNNKHIAITLNSFFISVGKHYPQT